MFETIFSVFRTKESDELNAFFVGRAVSIKPDFFQHIDSLDVPKNGWCVKSVNGKMATLVLANGKPGKLFIETKYLKGE
jgi:hypothetical protein